MMRVYELVGDMDGANNADSSGTVPPSSDLDMLAHMAGSVDAKTRDEHPRSGHTNISSHTPHRAVLEVVGIPFYLPREIQVAQGKDEGDSRMATTPFATSGMTAFSPDTSLASTPPDCHISSSSSSSSSSGPARLLSGSHTRQLRHQKSVDGIQYESGTATAATALISNSTGDLPFFQRNSQVEQLGRRHISSSNTTSASLRTPTQTFLVAFSASASASYKVKRDRAVDHHLQRPHQSSRAVVKVRALPLSAAKKFAKFCLESHHHHQHKPSLYTGQKQFRRVAAAAPGLLSPAPIISRHLRRRRASADSFSSSDSESAINQGRNFPTTPQHDIVWDKTGDAIMQQSHYIHTPTVAGIADHLANSLCLEKSRLQTLPPSLPTWASSPSAESTFSDHSLFSDQSHLTHYTNMSSRPASRNEVPASRLDAAHPAAHRILRLHEHSPGTTPKDSYMHAAAELDYFGGDSTTKQEMEPPFDDPNSRYFARRNAIAPLADPLPRQTRRGSSAFGPMRTAKALKTARTVFGSSHLAVPELPRPFSPPPKLSDRRTSIHQLVVPSRRVSLPAFQSKLSSPMKLAKLVMPTALMPKHSEAQLCSPGWGMDTDFDDGSSDDLDFCCKGYESPISVPPAMQRPSVLYSPYRRNSLAANVSQLSKRRGKTVPSLKLR